MIRIISGKRRIIIAFTMVLRVFLLDALANEGGELLEKCNKDKDCQIKAYQLKIGELEKEVEKLRGFTAHKPNYLQLYTVSSDDGDTDFPSSDANVKFQFSLKKRLYEFSFGDFFMGYSQKSFWRMYDAEDSRPFRESNYNPELFFRTDKTDGEVNWSIDFGAEHESNGQTEPLSRSWNRLYVKPTMVIGSSEQWYFKGSIKPWYRIPDPPKENPDDTAGDENPDIHEYYGSGELYLDIGYGDFQLSFMGRKNVNTNKGAARVDITVPSYAVENAYWHFQYFVGYGESLIDYNRSIRRYGIGVMFAR